MNILYIDTNIYLRFFDGNRKDLKKLLDTLLKISNNIFITNQIVSEIERNKLPVFKQSINNYTNKLKIETVTLPEHFTIDLKNVVIEDWNKQRETIRKENEKLTKEIDKIFIKNIELISKSQDSVSQKLEVIYKKTISATSEEISESKKRKELGNPPGKDSDPLGDQISWEQLLNRASTYNEIWIITNDSDYLTEYKGAIFLNSYLYSELLQKNSTLKVNCFTDLLSGLESYAKKSKLEDLIDKKTAKEIRQEEKQYRIVVESSNIQSIGYDSKGQTLEVEFLNGSLYQYFNVPQSSYNELINADSLGKYFIANIKGHYRYSKV